jgi:U3 small nucleolar RNA-associated protein 20
VIRFIVFGLELFHTALKRGRFDLSNPVIRSRLEAMVAIVGNSLFTNVAAVLILGMKAVTNIVKCPLKSLETSIPVFVRQMIDIVKQNGNTDSDIVQAALKSLAAILRDHAGVEIKEKDLSFLLDVVHPDLEEPIRQVAAFTILRAIISRKFIVPEIYDMMDQVSHILVTSQVPHVQELCRIAFLQFLLDYPQGKGKLRNHLTFLANNLSYPYESGRKSVLELLGAVISKFEVGLLRAYADLVFISLVLVLANDDSAKCREMAAVLIRALLNRLDDEHLKVMLSHLHAWSTQHSQPQIVAVSSQVYGIAVDLLRQKSLPYILKVLEDVNSQIAYSAEEFTNALIEVSNEDRELRPPSPWQVPYYAFTALEKILRVFPDYTTNHKVIWPDVVVHLVFPHAWVRTASCRLLGFYFAAVPPGPPNPLLPDNSPLSRQGMRDVAEKLCMQLKSIHLDATLSLQIVKNLFYLGKCFHAIPVGDTAESGMFSENEGELEAPVNDQNLLSWLFSRLSNQVRSAHTTRRNQSTAPVRILLVARRLVNDENLSE